MFRAADLVLLTKSDLIEVLGDFDPARATSYIRQLANPAPVLALSARTGLGVAAWCDWVLEEISFRRQKIAKESTTQVQPGSEKPHAPATERR
jgi:hydrogenase nickel incorporation protein HypB